MLANSIKSFLIGAILFIGATGYAAPSAASPENGGHCIPVMNTSLYLRVSGQSHPTIVFINGFGVDTSAWNKVIQAVDSFAKVVVYDRYGIGKSQGCSSKLPSTIDQAEILHQLLTNAHVNPPYILVGHSIGGLYAQLFAEKYPKEVTGVVLVDSSARNQISNLPLPANKQNPLYSEALNFRSGALQRTVREAGSFPDVPLIILTATKHAKRIKEADWQHWQSGFLALSPQSLQIIAWNSGHFIQTDQPDLVVDAIATMVKKVGS